MEDSDCTWPWRDEKSRKYISFSGITTSRKEWSIANDQTIKGGKEPAQMNKELLIKLEPKKEKFKRLKQGQMLEDEY